MGVHAAEGLSEGVDGVVVEGVRAGETLEEHEAAGDANRLVQPRGQHAAFERKLVLLRPRGQDVRLYDLEAWQRKPLRNVLGRNF